MGGGAFDLNGGSQQVASLSDYAGGGGSIINSNTSATAILTLSPTGTTTTYSGTILSGGTNGAIALVLNGNGTQVLAGANTYSGGTWVEAGTLIVNDSRRPARRVELDRRGGRGTSSSTPRWPARPRRPEPRPPRLAAVSCGS